ncbi:hypothetical protein LCGC14_1240710 [marine sediment metagenome]|uniref:Uncharacterized protein n=1 Tax=marine sediment metagenome TaxID=412755 RepID=A0A0F9L9Y6_9ZZZZ
MSLWKTIAKNELRLRTNKFRNHRVLFFIILYSSLIIWAFLLAPMLFDLFMPTLAEEIPGIIFNVALIIEFGMMAFFLSILIYPLNSVFRKTEIGFKEIVLASPATAGDIFIGEFIGKFPVYLACVLLFSPIIIGLLNSLINLSLIQYIIIYVCIFGLIIFATLLGSIIASWLEHKIAKSERFRDLGKVLVFLLSIAMIAMIYTLQFLFNFLINNPQLRNWLMIYPSLWFSNIILFIIDPILISSYILNIWFSIFLAIGMPLLILYISFKKADKFFTLEGGIEKISTIIERENKFYFLMRKITGNKWEGLVITQLKEFLRKRENMMKIVYVTGMTGVIGVIFSFILGDEKDVFVDSLVLVMLIYVGGMMYGLMFGSYIFVGSKDLIWVWARSPRDIPALVYSYMIAMLILNSFITLGLTIFFTIFLRFDIFSIIFFFTFYLINCEVVISQAIGIQCFNPSFEEKGRTMTSNIMVLMLIQMVPFQLLFFVMILFLPIPKSSTLAKLSLNTPLLLISLGVAIPLLYFGVKKLRKIE